MAIEPGQAQPIFDQGKPLLDQYAHLLPPLALAVLGGVVRALAGRRAGCSVWRLLADMCVNACVAVFVGAVILLCLQAVDWHPGIKGGVTGLSGWLGTDLLRVLASKWLDTVSKCTLAGGGK